MTQRLRLVTASTLSMALMVVGCGSDDAKHEDHKSGQAEGGTDAGGYSDRTPEGGKGGAAGAAGKRATGGAGGDSATITGAAGSESSTSCGDDTCKKPSICKESDGKAQCVCPDGYDDKDGDGTNCVDKDECANADDNDCDKHAECENKPGGYTCKCRGPAYKGDDGKSCSCADGYKEQDGLCLAVDGASCEDNLDCENGHCVGGTCCAQSCGVPDGQCMNADEPSCKDGKTCTYSVAKDDTTCDDGNPCTTDGTCKGGKCQASTKATDCNDKNPCTDDSCDPAIGCKNKNNTATCDDKNACTDGDRCVNGQCASGMTHDCSAQADGCNTGTCDPADGSCKKKPVADGAYCSDSKGCTKADLCKAGVCTGNSACGPNGTSCSEPAAGSEANSCECAATYVDKAGVCAPDGDDDECAQNPCDPNADCLDPSHAANDHKCTCKPGYKDDGKTCVLVDPCATNPCGEGRGTCSPMSGPTPTYVCNCSSGLVAVGGTCGCNLEGTFAVRTTFNASWAAADPLEGGMGFTYTWAIERHKRNADNSYAVEFVSCGESNLDLCGEGVDIAGIGFGPEGYAQYVPINVWKADGPAARLTMTAASPWPNGKFTIPHHATLVGISLTDPEGPWPASRKDVIGLDVFDGSATNGAQWINTDGDDQLGLTTYTVGPNGVAADGSALAPYESYGTHSKVCPRDNPSAPRSPYNYVPALEGLRVRRVTRFWSANRTISGFEGTFKSCDQIEGSMTGPDDGKPHLDTRIAGCQRQGGSGEPDVTACSAALVDSLDTMQTANDVLPSPVVIKRVADTIDCAGVRALEY